MRGRTATAGRTPTKFKPGEVRDFLFPGLQVEPLTSLTDHLKQPSPPLNKPRPMQIFCDLDGVLADFDTHYTATIGPLPPKNSPEGKKFDLEWDKVDSRQFFFELPPMPDYKHLWGYISRYDPIILTGVPRREGLNREKAIQNKRDWVDRHIGAHARMIATESEHKRMYMRPGDLLIDDWEKYMHLWKEAGGLWITHTSAENTIRELQLLGL